MSDTISSDSVAQDQLRAFIERIERMEEEKKAISDDIKEIYAEAKGNGFDTKVLRQIVRIRKMDANERAEQEALLDLYMGALGMAPMPLFDDDDEPPPRGGRRQQADNRPDAGGLRPISITIETREPSSPKITDEVREDPEAFYAKAVELVRGHDKVAPSLLQQRLVVGYNKACNWLERMEREGIVASRHGDDFRQVLDQPSGNSGEFNPASLTSNSQAERRPESTEQSAGANADEAVPSALSAPIQPATAAQTGSDVLSDRTPAEQVQVGPDPSLVEREAVESSATHSDEPDSPAFAEADTPKLQAASASNSLGSAADKSGSGGVSPVLSAPADPEALYAKAVELVLQEGRASPSMLQRRLVVGFNRASDLVERMEREGVVARSPAGFLDVVNHDGPTFQPEASIH